MVITIGALLATTIGLVWNIKAGFDREMDAFRKSVETVKTIDVDAKIAASELKYNSALQSTSSQLKAEISGAIGPVAAQIVAKDLETRVRLIEARVVEQEKAIEELNRSKEHPAVGNK